MTSRSQLPINLTELMLQRICAEYLEMPGLQLTVEQAQRLWGLDKETCVRALEFLVENRFLVRTGGYLYARLTEGSIAVPAFPMAKASLSRPRDSRFEPARAS
jgi:hypothetical protein